MSASSSRDVDIRDAGAGAGSGRKARPDWIVLAAAYTDVDGCESHPELALAVNRDGAVNVAQAAKQIGAKLLFLSSDYVFDGKKTSPYEAGDARNPQSVYGRSKAEAEVRLLEVLPECCIARTSWLFGDGREMFSGYDSETGGDAGRRWMWSTISAGARRIPWTWRGRSSGCAASDASGIVHVTNAGDCSWFEFAREIVKGAGLRDRGAAGQQPANGASGAASGVFRSVAEEPAAVWDRHARLAGCAAAVFAGAQQLSFVPGRCFASPAGC